MTENPNLRALGNRGTPCGNSWAEGGIAGFLWANHGSVVARIRSFMRTLRMEIQIFANFLGFWGKLSRCAVLGLISCAWRLDYLYIVQISRKFTILSLVASG